MHVNCSTLQLAELQTNNLFGVQKKEKYLHAGDGVHNVLEFIHEINPSSCLLMLGLISCQRPASMPTKTTLWDTSANVLRDINQKMVDKGFRFFIYPFYIVKCQASIVQAIAFCFWGYMTKHKVAVFCHHHDDLISTSCCLSTLPIIPPPESPSIWMAVSTCFWCMSDTTNLPYS